jgi:capsule synthesis protein PGA_cap
VSGRRFRVVAVGDLQLGDSPTSVGFGFRSRYTAADLGGALDALRPLLHEGDIVFGNLEAPLSSSNLIANSWASRQLRGDPEYAPVLRSAGFTVMNVANNHAVQHGVDAFNDSVGALRAAGIVPCGIRGSGAWASEPVTLTAGSARVGLLAYCLRPRQYGPEEPPYAEGSPAAIRADIARLRQATDAVLVSLHWGEEFVSLPSVAETELGRSLIDAGASMIIGHHPHVTRPVERYGGGLIAYSLGNCVGDMVWYAPFRRGAVVSADIEDGEIRAAIVRTTQLDARYRPVVAAGDERLVAPGDFEPLPADQYAAAIARTWREQRLAVYWYVLLRTWRVPPRLLMQLVGRTIANKIRALAGHEP